jgi:hypothetical protein
MGRLLHKMFQKFAKNSQFFEKITNNPHNAPTFQESCSRIDKNNKNLTDSRG